MLLVLCLGIMFSTFLSSPVAVLATVSAVLVGFVGQFITALWTQEVYSGGPKVYGGGPIESLIRLVTQMNVMTDLDLNPIVLSVLKVTDWVLLTIMHSIASILPSFAALGRPAEYVAYNLNIYGDLLARHLLTTLVYVTAVTIVGYFFLKTREIAA